MPRMMRNHVTANIDLESESAGVIRFAVGLKTGNVGVIGCAVLVPVLSTHQIVENAECLSRGMAVEVAPDNIIVVGKTDREAGRS
jgi:hypothetical protein